MPITDARIDAYIDKSADFAKPILKHLRQLMHKACPDVVETMKWSMPFFDYNGTVMCNMAAFKEHCRLFFWKSKLMNDPEKILPQSEDDASKLNKITSLKNLPSDKILMVYIKGAMLLNEGNIKLPPKKKAVIKDLEMPGDFGAALKKNKAAQTVFEKFSPGKQKEYIEWITEAKTQATKDKRIETAVEWIAEGKSRHWKYQG